MEDDTSFGNILEMHLSGRNECLSTVVDESFKSSSCDNNEEHGEQVGDLLVVNEKTINIPTNYDGRIERYVRMEDILKEAASARK